MLRFILFCIVALSGYYLYLTFPLKHGPGIMVDSSPAISRAEWIEEIYGEEYQAKPVSLIEGIIRVLKVDRYFFDSRAEFSPISIVAGWDEMSDERNLDHLFIDMNNRGASLEYARPPLKPQTMYNQSALYHLIPNDLESEKKIKFLRPGNILKIKGYIVNVTQANGYVWKSEFKMSKSDQFPQKYILVEDIKVL